MLPAVRMVPKPAEFMFAVGELKLTTLSALVSSARNSSFIRSTTWNTRKKPMSTYFAPGLSRMLRPELPSAPATGALKAAVLNQALEMSLRERLASSFGLPTRSPRSLLLPSTLVSCPVVTVKGVPLRMRPMAETDHLLSMLASTLLPLK